MGRRHEEGGGYGSEDRNLLRVVAGYEDFPPTGSDIARMMGISRQRTTALASVLVHGGLLSCARGMAGTATYSLTDAGRRELDAHVAAYLLVKADDRLAEDIAYYTERNVGGVLSVEVHGQGCCCQHCPHGGNCRD
jgi:hypothetical protein